MKLNLDIKFIRQCFY